MGERYFQYLGSDGFYHKLDTTTNAITSKKGKKVPYTGVIKIHEADGEAKLWTKGVSSTFPEKWTEETKVQVLAAFAEGAAIVEVCEIIGVHKSTFYIWLGHEEKQDFRDTIKMGIQTAEAWWSRQGRSNLNTKGYNTALWIVNMRHRWGWNVSAVGGVHEALEHLGQEAAEAQATKGMVDSQAIVERGRQSLKEWQQRASDTAIEGEIIEEAEVQRLLPPVPTPKGKNGKGNG